MSERILDLNGLPPPEPFERAMAAAEALGEGERLCILLWREPFPLYQALLAHGFAYSSRQVGEQFEIRVWRQARGA